jgi:hypothetical protein
LADTDITEESDCILLEAAAQSQLKKIWLNKILIPTEWKELKLDEIRIFMKSKRKGSAKSKQLKLFILGKEKHGKISLLYNLKRKQEELSVRLMKTELIDGINIST